MRLCRICRKADKTSSFINMLGNNGSLASQLYHLCGILVQNGVEIAIICEPCSKSLEKACQLKRQAMESNVFFKNSKNPQLEEVLVVVKQELDEDEDDENDKMFDQSQFTDYPSYEIEDKLEMKWEEPGSSNDDDSQDYIEESLEQDLSTTSIKTEHAEQPEDEDEEEEEDFGILEPVKKKSKPKVKPTSGAEESTQEFLCQNCGEVFTNADAMRFHVKNHVKRQRRKGPKIVKTANKAEWRSEKLKKLRQSGQPYVDKNFTYHEGKTMKEPCLETCKLKCSQRFDETTRQTIFNDFWSKTDAEKRLFYDEHVAREPVKRHIKHRELQKNQTFSLKYHFVRAGNKERVCAVMFISTLGVSKNRLYYFVKSTKDKPVGYNHGKHPSNILPTEIKEAVKDHINSFPRVGLHRCPDGTTMEYLDSSLSMQQMYFLFTNKHPKVKISYSSFMKIFRRDFTLSFLSIKSTQCDKCFNQIFILNS